jgi:TrmH family RNA methyltransferase
MEIITSKENSLIKKVKSLNEKKYRDMYGDFFVEGEMLVLEALAENFSDIKIIICKELYKNFEEKFKDTRASITYVTQTVFNYISNSKTPQGIMAVLKIPKQIDLTLKTAQGKSPITIFALDGISDPRKSWNDSKNARCSRD